MEDVLTVAQIEAQFPSEWVLIEEPRTNDALEVQSGKVHWHSKDREEVYRKVVEMHPKRFAILYTGKMPEDTAIVLCIFPSTRGRSGVLFARSCGAPQLAGLCALRLTPARRTPC